MDSQNFLTGCFTSSNRVFGKSRLQPPSVLIRLYSLDVHEQPKNQRHPLLRLLHPRGRLVVDSNRLEDLVRPGLRETGTLGTRSAQNHHNHSVDKFGPKSRLRCTKFPFRV